MEKQETIADIIAEMRFHGQQNIDAEKDKPEYGILTVEGRIAQNYADRLEAAWKREKAAIEANALAVGGMVEASRATAENSSVVGDCAKMREALQQAKVAILAARKKMGVDNPIILEIIDAALAAPPRNCDVYDHRYWVDEFEKYMGKSPSQTADEQDEYMKENWFLFYHWLCASATEEGENDGR